MTTADSTYFYLGGAALLLAVVMLRLILAVMFGGQSSRVERVADEIVAAAD